MQELGDRLFEFETECLNCCAGTASSMTIGMCLVEGLGRPSGAWMVSKIRAVSPGLKAWASLGRASGASVGILPVLARSYKPGAKRESRRDDPA